MGQNFSNAYLDIGEVHSYTLGILILTNRQSFDYMQINMSLTQTNSSLYSNFTNPNCDIGTIKTLLLPFEAFNDTMLMVDGLSRIKFLYKEYPNSLCPLGLYNTSLAVFTNKWLTFEHDTIILNQFETSK